MTKCFATSLLLALTLMAACKGSTDPDPDPDPTTEDSFTTNTLDQYTGYSLSGSGGPGTWTIAGGNLTGTGPANQSVLIRSGTSMTNGWVETVTSHADDGGLVLRFSSPDNYYLLALRDDSAPAPLATQNLSVYHHSGTAYNEMWRSDVVWPRGTARRFRFEAQGSLLRVYMDGSLQVELTAAPAINDPTPYVGPGLIGVRNYGASGGWMATYGELRWGTS
ncbi:MAG TPA: hypothetical protein VNP72_02275 [Longimicrobium sp.]|nr:hypothetical protein [Longimicrobium sp.]